MSRALEIFASGIEQGPLHGSGDAAGRLPVQRRALAVACNTVQDGVRGVELGAGVEGLKTVEWIVLL